MSNSGRHQTDHERLIRRLLKPDKVEALSWLEGGVRLGRRTVGEFKDRRSSTSLVKQVYRAGASEVFAVDIKSDAAGNEHTGKLVVALPNGAEARAKVFDWCKAQGESLGFSPEQDGGEEYMFLLLD